MNDKKAQTRERILTAASAALIQRGPAEPSVKRSHGRSRAYGRRLLCAFRQQGSDDAGSVQPIARPTAAT